MSSKADYVWMDGEFVAWDDAKVPILTHALHYGTAIFEGIRAYPSEGNVNVFRLQDHIERMMQSARTYFIEHGYSVKELCDATLELLRRNSIRSRAYIRPIIYVGCKGIGLNFTGFPIDAAIIAIPYESYFDKPALKLKTSTWRRFSEASTPPLAKASGNYLNSVLAKLEAIKDGYDDAVMLDMRGSISEGTGENIFIVKSGEILTPPYSSSILKGITRDTVKHIVADMGKAVVEREIARFELYNADEAFFSGTAAEIASIVEVDRRRIGEGRPGVLTMKVSSAYSDIVTGRNEKYSHWLTPVY